MRYMTTINIVSILCFLFKYTISHEIYEIINIYLFILDILIVIYMIIHYLNSTFITKHKNT